MFGLRQIPRIYLRRGYEQTIEIGGLADPFLVVSSDFLELTAEEDPRLLSGMIAGRIAGPAAALDVLKKPRARLPAMRGSSVYACTTNISADT